MLSQQFGPHRKCFNKMANDRRRNQELRDAFGFVQELARAIDRDECSAKQLEQHSNGLMTDIGREIDSGGSNDGGYPDQGRGGRITWKGRVDDMSGLYFVEEQRISKLSVELLTYDAQANFINSCQPARCRDPYCQARTGKRSPLSNSQSRENDFACIIRIRDTKGGADNYEFELSW
jgi:hypothetical protein